VITTSIAPSTAATPATAPSAAALLGEQDVPTQTDTAYSLDWSVDGETLAVASGVEITMMSKDLAASVAVVKPASGALAAAWSPDATTIATVGGLRNRIIGIWNWDSKTGALTEAQRVSANSDQFAVSWSPDGTQLATLASDRASKIQVWDTSTWKLAHEFDLPYANPRRALNWSSDGTTINDAGELDGRLVYFSVDASDGSVQQLGALPIDAAYVLAYSPDLQKIAVADERGNVQIHDTKSGGLLVEFQSVTTPADLAWNPENGTLAVLGYDTKLQLWSLPG